MKRLMVHSTPAPPGFSPCTGVTVSDVAVPDVDDPPCAARVSAAVRNLFAFESFAAEVDTFQVSRIRNEKYDTYHDSSPLPYQPGPYPSQRRSSPDPSSDRRRQPPPQPHRMPFGSVASGVPSVHTLLSLYALYKCVSENDVKCKRRLAACRLCVSSVHRWV